MSGFGDINGRRPTIRDVAAQAGVSKSLVSLVMRGEPMVRDDKRRRVLEVAEELGYRMDLAARSLSNVGSRTIGVLVADLRNPSLVDVFERAGHVFEHEGFSTLPTSAVIPSRATSGSRLDSRAIGALKDLRVEATLVVGSVPDQDALAEVLEGVLEVIAAACAEGLSADVVRNDDHLGMRLVVDYLVAAGHTAVAHIGGHGGTVAEERVAGYCMAMAHHGLNPEIVIADSDFTEDAGYRAAARLLRGDRPVTAITAVNDLAAFGAMSAVADAGLLVPDHVAVTGYDDTYVSAIRQVSLTSVNPDTARIGPLAAQCVLCRIEDPARPMEATVVADVDPTSPFSQEELFGPAVAVSKADDWESAIAQANGTPFGLAAGLFTADIAGAVRAIREIDAGNVHINWTPLWRADLMPYGGLKGSGIGKEGPRTAVAEMTEEKTVVLHGKPW